MKTLKELAQDVPMTREFAKLLIDSDPNIAFVTDMMRFTQREVPMRCEATHPERGTQCGLPAYHHGQHGNGTICPPWSDAPARRPESDEPQEGPEKE